VVPRHPEDMIETFSCFSKGHATVFSRLAYVSAQDQAVIRMGPQRIEGFTVGLVREVDIADGPKAPGRRLQWRAWGAGLCDGIVCYCKEGVHSIGQRIFSFNRIWHLFSSCICHEESHASGRNQKQRATVSRCTGHSVLPRTTSSSSLSYSAIGIGSIAATVARPSLLTHVLFRQKRHSFDRIQRIWGYNRALLRNAALDYLLG
jgi:hypothetical protein